MSKLLLKETAQKAYDMMKAIKRDNRGNPYTLEDTIRAIILKSPDSSPYRDDALGTLYCTLGAGIDWIDGRVGDIIDDNYISMPPHPGGRGCWTRGHGIDESLEKIFGMKKDLLKIFKKEWKIEEEIRIEKIIKTINNIDKRCQMYTPKGERWWYPFSWYGANICPPQDAQEDFRDGAIETLHLVLNTEYQVGTKDWMNHQRTKTYAKQILKAVMMANKDKIE